MDDSRTDTNFFSKKIKLLAYSTTFEQHVIEQEFIDTVYYKKKGL